MQVNVKNLSFIVIQWLVNSNYINKNIHDIWSFKVKPASKPALLSKSPGRKPDIFKYAMPA